MRNLLVIAGLALLLATAGCADVVDDSEGVTDDGADIDDDSDDSANEDADSTTAGGTERIAVDGELEIHHIDVGQADSTLIITPTEETILVDTGDWRQDGAGVIAYLDELGIERIDHLVATHGHADHIGGHAAIIETFETERDGIGTAYDSGVPHTSATYDNYLDAIEDHDVELLIVEDGDELPLADEDLGAHVLNPPAGESGDDLHENSVALAFEFGEFSYLTTGDAERDAEERMVAEWGETLDSTVYQAGHHGSSTSSTAPFLDEVSPEIAVISSNYDSQYGHPHDETLQAFGDRGIETYWTGVHGHVVVTTNGTAVDVTTEAEFSSDPEELLAEKHDEARAIGAGAIDVTPAPIEG